MARTFQDHKPKRGRPRAAQGRVLLQRPAGVDAFGSRTGTTDGELTAFAADFRLATRYGSVRTHPVVRLTEDGIDWGVWPAPADEVGYGMDPHRTDDCLAAAVATATQIPVEQVPDFALDARLADGEDPADISRSTWERLDAWATKRGLTLRFWSAVPVPRPRWIGVVRSPGGDARYAFAEGGAVVRDEGTHFNDHCLVMSHGRLVFDPSCSVKVPPGALSVCFSPDQITQGITLDKEDD